MIDIIDFKIDDDLMCEIANQKYQLYLNAVGDAKKHLNDYRNYIQIIDIIRGRINNG